MAEAEEDLYGVLGLSADASQQEIRKAYRKAALEHHPDKAHESKREEAEVRFKSIGTAYEILQDEDKRSAYDRYGMSAFTSGGGRGQPGAFDMEDLFAQMMSGLGGGAFSFMDDAGPTGPRKSKDQTQEYPISLEDLYRGKTVRFASTKNVICTHCEGRGGRHKSKARQCTKCKGKGKVVELRPVAPGLVTQVTELCRICNGDGKVFAKQDQCRKCKGQKVVQVKKALEAYIPRGSREGEKITLPGEADQVSGQEPGDLILILREREHETFTRVGYDLSAQIDVLLSEALGGFSRVVVQHLDGRGISITHPAGKALKPGEVLRIKEEGMPHKKTDTRGDLYLRVNVIFPESDWLAVPKNITALKEVLPIAEESLALEQVDERAFEQGVDGDEFGSKSTDPRFRSEWVDEDEEMDGGGGGWFSFG